MKFKNFYKKDLINEELFISNFEDDYKKLLNCGGAAGHMSHFYDIKTNTFKDLKDFIATVLSGEINVVKEKLDGLNIMVSYINGRLRAARNKSHLRNFGKDSLDVSGIKAKFKGRGGVETAFSEAMVDLAAAISKLTPAQQEKIFDNGKKWMNVEILYPEAPNIIPYGLTKLVLHGTLEYDENGNVIGDSKTDANILAGMIKQVKQDQQKTFGIKADEVLQLPKIEDLEKHKQNLYSKISNIQKEYKMNDSNSIQDVVEQYFSKLIDNNLGKVSATLKNNLIQRWSESGNSVSIKSIENMVKDEDLFSKIKEIDINSGKHFNKIIFPFDEIVSKLGVIVLKNISSIMSVNSDEIIKKLKRDLNNTIKQVEGSNDPRIIERMKQQLKRLQAIGGTEAILPIEGIVFEFRGQTYKLTGGFSSLNIILGMRFIL